MRTVKRLVRGAAAALSTLTAQAYSSIADLVGAVGQQLRDRPETQCLADKGAFGFRPFGFEGVDHADN